MARIRTIKPGFFTSLTVASLPLSARITFIGLWTEADDQGRLLYDPRLIKAAIWPLDERTKNEVHADVKWLVDNSLVTHYIAGDRSYLWITNWEEHQRVNRPNPSLYPSPEEGTVTPLSWDHEDSLRTHGAITEDSLRTHGAITEDSLPERKGKERNKEGKGKEGRGSSAEVVMNGPTTARKATRVSADFSPTHEMISWAQATIPSVDIRMETQKFVNYWIAKAGKDATKLDWPRTWQNWMLKASEYAPTKNGHKPSTTDQRVAQAMELANKYKEIEEQELRDATV